MRDMVRGILVVLMLAATMYSGAAYFDTKQEVTLCSLLSCG